MAKTAPRSLYLFGAPVFPVHAPGFVSTLHRDHERGTGESRTSASGTVYMAEHSGTHIDALCHQAEDLHLYGGREVNAHLQTSAGFTELGVETIAPLITRGILLDAARHRGVDRIEAGRPVNRDDLEAMAQSQGVSVGEAANWRRPLPTPQPKPPTTTKWSSLASSC